MCVKTAAKSERQVLPTNVTPLHYDLTLQPNLETFDFLGHVKVDLNINEDSTKISFNANGLKIVSATVAYVDIKTESTQTATDIAYDEKKESVTLTFAETLKANSKTVLDIKFNGVLNDQMAGFYRSSYKDANGETRYLATTQFESTDARRAFPCWDEPALKATFDITLVVPAHLTALSNMDVLSDKPYPTETQTSGEVLKQVKYSTTPLMSTYLVAFVVGPFEYIEDFSSGEHNGQPIRSRVYTLPGVVEQGRHALNVCVKAIEYFAKVFGEPYPLPKIDMVAIPDFEAGAMENWGLVTYRTVALLFDEKSSSISSKKSTAYTVCHEIAHQWFGNLVTMEWWDHLWLNEGFATWVGWLAVDNVFPDWDIWTSFVNSDMPSALKLDALRSSHPIEVAVNDPAEIQQIFDAISYYKGASVIRMLSSWLGVDIFLAGVRRYLSRHKWGNASTNDLWVALSEEAGVDVSEFMTLWTRHVGYPVLKVETDETTYKVSQSRYLSTGDLTEEEDSTVWWAPLNVLTTEKVEPLTLVEKTQTFPLPKDGLFKLNAGQTSVYRVNYPIEAIRKLAEEIKKGEAGLLSNTTDRVGLIADAGNLCASGEQETSTFLELVEAFTNETDYFVLSQLSTHLGNILSVWYEQPKEVRNCLKALRRSLFSPLAHKLGWEFAETDDYVTNTLRVLVIANAGKSNDTVIVEEAKRRFWAYMKGDSSAIHPNLRGTVYSIVLSSAEDEEEEVKVWEEILKEVKNESLPDDQRLLALTALGGMKSHALVVRFLNMSFDEKEVRNQDSIYVYRSLATNSDAREVFWEFFKNNYIRFTDKFAKSVTLLGAATRSVVGGFASFDKIKDVEEFFADKEVKEFVRALQQ
ncbi:peptidase family M1-domain-containing protein, partial [Spinellus fusiger]